MPKMKSKPDTSGWKIEIHHVDYETGEELDLSRFTPEEIAARKKIILDRAFAGIGYYPTGA